MIPHEKTLVERLKDRRFAFIGINSDPKEKAKKLLADNGITWRNAVDGGAPEGYEGGPLSKAWQVTGWPTIYVLDASGVIRYRDVRDKEMDDAVDKLLAEIEGK